MKNNSTLIFWQNIISPHQLTVLQAIPKIKSNIKVILVVAKNMEAHRAEMGWQTTDVQNNDSFQILIAPKQDQIRSLFINNHLSQHFFSGIRATSMVFDAFKISFNYNIKRHLITEGPTYYKRPKILHIIKTIILDRKYFKKINNVYTIGKDAQDWYKFWGFQPQNIIPFSYCVESTNAQISMVNTDKTIVKFLYVGSLIKLKGLDQFLDQILKLPIKISLDIIGHGNEIDVLKEKVSMRNTLHQINFLGNKPNYEIRQLMLHYDIFALPSLYDGWGAVVNEALMSGLFVICSDQCGAQELIHDKFNGIVFSHNKKNDLYQTLEYCLNNIDEIRNKKQAIKDWSKCIEAETIAKYFLDTLNNGPTTPPWKKLDFNRNHTYQ